MTPAPLLKADLRKSGVTRRKSLRAKTPQAGEAVAQRLVELFSPLERQPITIAGYITLGDELDCAPALAALNARGFRLALPVAAAWEARLTFRLWHHGMALEKGPFGTQHPLADAADAVPEVLLVPLVAFDKAGHRLGYGAGYYDRAIAELRARWTVTAIGLGYDGQEIAKIPEDPNDQRLDAVVTEARVLQFKQPLFARN